MATTYKVVKGDTLWDIVQKPAYAKLIAGNTINAKIKTVAKINNIKDPDYIVVGQVLKLSGSTATTTSSTANAPTINVFGLRSNSERTMYAGWTWSKSGTKGYEIKWSYKTAEGLWLTGTQTSVGTDKAYIFDAPEDAVQVGFKVRAEYTKEDTYSGWSATSFHSFVDAPEKPLAPNVTIEGKKLTATINDPDGDFGGTIAVFEIWRNNTTKWDTSGDITIATGYASWVSSKDIVAGYSYKVRCKIVKVANGQRISSEWSDYSNSIASRPTAPNLKQLRVMSEDSIMVIWLKSSVKNAELKISYEIQYIVVGDDETYDPSWFDITDRATSVKVDVDTDRFIIDGLSLGAEYFFRVRAISTGEGETSGGDYSDWSSIDSIKLGKKPAAPTTWSSASTAIMGQPIYLYWVHNSEDGSSETTAIIRYRRADGEIGKYTYVYINNDATGDEKDDVKSYEFDTSVFPEGAEIEWSVRTAGIMFSSNTESNYSSYSETRSFKIYAEPELGLSMDGLTNDDEYDYPLLKAFPIRLTAWNENPDTVQKPIGYTVEIRANQSHEMVNYRGETVVVNEGDIVYSQFFDNGGDLELTLSAINTDLADNIHYTLICKMAMDSGLTSEAHVDFITNFDEVIFDVNADIALEPKRYTSTIRPYVTDDEGVDPSNILLSVYRREYDGRFTELARDLENGRFIHVTDPHPSLDIPRYRVVATYQDTGTVIYSDVTGPSFDAKPVVIQWDEEWRNYESSEDAPEEEYSWAGSMLKLPYNIDVSDTRQPDVRLIKYIGRENPVAYYGTHRNETSTWNITIAAEDKETIYALRRLSSWSGNVYVREPSGMGYWANINVSFNLKHMEVAVPVTLAITRVEGGA